MVIICYNAKHLKFPPWFPLTEMWCPGAMVDPSNFAALVSIVRLSNFFAVEASSWKISGFWMLKNIEKYTSFGLIMISQSNLAIKSMNISIYGCSSSHKLRCSWVVHCNTWLPERMGQFRRPKGPHFLRRICLSNQDGAWKKGCGRR